MGGGGCPARDHPGAGRVGGRPGGGRCLHLDREASQRQEVGGDKRWREWAGPSQEGPTCNLLTATGPQQCPSLRALPAWGRQSGVTCGSRWEGLQGAGMEVAGQAEAQGAPPPPLLALGKERGVYSC